jgi:hypothetical protein
MRRIGAQKWRLNHCISAMKGVMRLAQSRANQAIE